MEPGEIYHLYNHANGFENLFKQPEDYEIFLSKVVRNTAPVARYYAYCLMPNHYHFLLRIREEEEIYKLIRNNDLSKKISRSFANAFAGYTLAMNNKYDRYGSLFTQNMRNRPVLNELDFCGTVHYIHANPVHHGFSSGIEKWPYSSYNNIVQNDSHWLDTKSVLEHFGDLHEFLQYHKKPIELKLKEKVYQ